MVYCAESMYERSGLCVRVEREVSECLEMKGGLGNGCVMPLWLLVDLLVKRQRVERKDERK